MRPLKLSDRDILTIWWKIRGAKIPFAWGAERAKAGSDNHYTFSIHSNFLYLYEYVLEFSDYYYLFENNNRVIILGNIQ